MKVPVGILGATGMVGQRFIALLENHPYFEVACLAASPRSAGKSYAQAVENRWKLDQPIPDYAEEKILFEVESGMNKIVEQCRLVFSALDLPKDEIKRLEEDYAHAGAAVVSNNSAHRWTEDVPMIMPEINPDHTDLIQVQRQNRGWDKGLLVVKPNCSLQSYIPIIYALADYGPTNIEVTTLQAISGAGKTFVDWPEMVENCIPFIEGEEDKTEKEPLKILGTLDDSHIEPIEGLNISATCVRVPILDGHMASVAVRFKHKPTLDQIKTAITNFANPINELNLPFAPDPFIHYFEEVDRPQTRIDRMHGRGMAISCGRFREDPIFDWKFVSLAHNTVRGAAGGAILTAELLYAKGLL